MIPVLACPICKTEVDTYTETYTSPYNKQEYKKYECPTCDVHWWEPLKIIPEFYESEVFEFYSFFHEGIQSSWVGRWRKPFLNIFLRM